MQLHYNKLQDFLWLSVENEFYSPTLKNTELQKMVTIF